MSKTSYALIGLMVAALLYMGAARLYQAWQRYAQAQEAAALNDGEPFSFQHVPVSLAAPQAEPMQAPVPYQPYQSSIYLEDTPLQPAARQVQAQQTLHSIVEDFTKEPSFAQFNQDLQATTQGSVQNLADLSSQNLAQLIQKNPEIVRVVQQHLSNPDFASKINEIFSNPQFQQSVQQLQGQAPAPAATPSAAPAQPVEAAPALPLHRLAGSR